jgi:hypothetical protein
MNFWTSFFQRVPSRTSMRKRRWPSEHPAFQPRKYPVIQDKHQHQVTASSAGRNVPDAGASV